jgi:hypothetical protein
MLRKVLVILDAVLGWRARLLGAVQIGRGTTIEWRRLRRVSGNQLLSRHHSAVQRDESLCRQPAAAVRRLPRLSGTCGS